MRVPRSTAVVLAGALALVGAPSPAWAGGMSINSTSAIDNCTGGGTYIGGGSNSLSNGSFTSGFCAYSNHAIGTANDQYKKTSGSTVQVYFTWEFTNSNGGVSVNRQPATGPIAVSSGQTISAQGRYPSPGIASTSGSAGCVRGVMSVGADTFTTSVRCW